MDVPLDCYSLLTLGKSTQLAIIQTPDSLL